MYLQAIEIKLYKILLFISIISFNSFAQKNGVGLNPKPSRFKNTQVILVKICKELLKTDLNYAGVFYSNERMIFSNRLLDSHSLDGMNVGYISIDTVNLSVRFHYTGRTGSGGFAPYIRYTLYLKGLTAFEWKEMENGVNKLNLMSSYDGRFNTIKPLYESEEFSGYKNSEDYRGGPDYKVERYSDYELYFHENKFTNQDKRNLSIWLNMLINLKKSK